MVKIFVSYSRHDGKPVRQLVEILTRAGYRVSTDEDAKAADRSHQHRVKAVQPMSLFALTDASYEIVLSRETPDNEQTFSIGNPLTEADVTSMRKSPAPSAPTTGLASVDTQIQPLIDTANPAIN